MLLDTLSIPLAIVEIEKDSRDWMDIQPSGNTGYYRVVTGSTGQKRPFERVMEMQEILRRSGTSG